MLARDANILHAGDATEGSGTGMNSLEYKERQKMRDLARQVRASYREESRSELLRETLREAISDLAAIRVPTLLITKNSERALVVGIADFHYGARIDVKGILGDTINYYNYEVFEKRMAELLAEIIEIISKESISDVYVMIVGDMIDGMLRQSQLMRLEYGVVESTVHLSEYLAQWLTNLSAYCEVSVYGASGNHSEIRPLKSKHGEFEEENLERIVFWYLHERLKDNERINIEDDVGKFKLVEVCGFRFLLIHGDGERSIDRIASDTIKQYGVPIDFFVCGHKHRENEFPSGMTSTGDSVIIRVPSICGVDAYAQSKGYNGKPGAVATIIERGYGRRSVYPIQL